MIEHDKNQEMAPERKNLIQQAGECWRWGIANHRSDNPFSVKDNIDNLKRIAQVLKEPSLDFAIEQLTHISAFGISNINVGGTMGSGKSSLGASLAEQLKGWTFRDADYFHPDENVKKMASQIPLKDSDRLTFLSNVQEYFRNNGKSISSCSALKDSYRAMLQGADDLGFDASRWKIEKPIWGLVQIMIMKPFDVALYELDFSEKYSRAGRTFANQPHFIHVTYEECEILKKQYQDFQFPSSWNAIVIESEKYRVARDDDSGLDTYDKERMIEDTLKALGLSD